MKAIGTLLVGIAFSAGVLRAQPAVEPMDLKPYQQRAADLFNPRFVTDNGSELVTAADGLLVMCQAVAVVVVVAGMVAKIRKDQVQMEGVASMMLKVAFIAMVPMLRVRLTETVDAAASALGYQTVTAAGASAPLMTELWGLFGQWTPPGSPYLDALESQGAGMPASGHEQEWALSAWNWAKGVGTTTSSVVDAAWQSVSGGMRAGAVFAGCGAMSCAMSLTLVIAYTGEVLRYLLFFAGCAVLPVFIAALGVDALRGSAVRFIVFLVSVACWPVGWALAHGVTAQMTRGLLAWISSVSATALTVGPGADVPPLATAAPFVGWGGLFLFMGATIAICVWVLGTLVYAPIAIGRLASAGATAVVIAVGEGAIGVRAATATVAASRYRSARTDPRALVGADAGPRSMARPGFLDLSVVRPGPPAFSMRETGEPAGSVVARPSPLPSRDSGVVCRSDRPAGPAFTREPVGSHIAPWLLPPSRRAAK